ncbi:hypothetical protein BDP27DRAFT_353874 [Rhodocollybia butyracea]|uniref:Uncharacterized protein n=1 Tax=Rhodocollybia butyracea TaxID=206335 RepID=A0A9P5Q2T1_9AGAR|nr:hypothetical protein BDP27DRAFT_353874 [Rhodocollybia butyracea]
MTFMLQVLCSPLGAICHNIFHFFHSVLDQVFHCPRVSGCAMARCWLYFVNTITPLILCTTSAARTSELLSLRRLAIKFQSHSCTSH